MARFSSRTGFYDGRSVAIRTVHHEFGAAWQFTGGARVRWSNATFPFAKLTFDTELARITVTSGLLGGPFWVRRDEVTEVVPMRGLLFSPGLMFATDDGSFDGLIFWTFSQRAAMEAFAAAGWPVDPRYRPAPPVAPR